MVDDHFRYFPRDDRSRLATVVVYAGIVFFGWWVATAIVDPSVLNVVHAVLGIAFLAKVVLDEARGIVVDRTGVHQPMRRVVRWESVEAVFPGDVWLALRCTDRNYRDARLPTRFAADVSRIGAKPLETGFTPVGVVGAPELHEPQRRE